MADSADINNQGGEQLGFDGLLATADQDNTARRFERETAHLPDTMDEALPFYRCLTDDHHAAMMAADAETVMRLREEAHLLAKRVNGGEPGIIAGDNPPGCVLERETAAAPGVVPLWGQTATFEITVRGMPVRIELAGIFGIGARFCYWPGFAAHAVDYDAPYISGTGYRSFLGIHAEPVPETTPDAFAARIIEAHIDKHLKGRLVEIGKDYRPCNN